MIPIYMHICMYVDITGTQQHHPQHHQRKHSLDQNTSDAGEDLM